ncbi:MAG: hypothetical protein IPL50_13555 [Chitinophagaceae bacterium]|nr:hypothetical protein [Chitinophagaceae bacterium]
MNRNQILKTDILDIIFENRNKAYGAYELRKFYPTRIKKCPFLYGNYCGSIPGFYNIA